MALAGPGWLWGAEVSMLETPLEQCLAHGMHCWGVCHQDDPPGSSLDAQPVELGEKQTPEN